MKLIQSALLSSIPGITHGFSDRSIGGDSNEIQSILKLDRISFLNQIHSGIVVVIDGSSSNAGEIEGDAQVCRLGNQGVGVVTADCVPILMASRDGSVVAAVHSGWRGTLGEICLNTLKVIQDRFDIRPENLVASIGPCIARCCYEIGAEVAEQFRQKFPDILGDYLFDSGSGKYHLDLYRANELMLQRAGVQDVDVLNICTMCSDEFYSYRRDGKGTGRQLSAIGILGSVLK